jgi:hypothetical protein
MSEVRVYSLEIDYPEGSDAPGWRPALWDDPKYLAGLPREERRALRKREFRWPRERHFLSSSGAYGRALLLSAYGCLVTVRRSDAVTWPERPDDWVLGDTAANWYPELDDLAERRERTARAVAEIDWAEEFHAQAMFWDDYFKTAEGPHVQDR